MITFRQVYDALDTCGPGFVLSSRGTRYRIEARDNKILAFPQNGRVTIHEDCWLQNTTCQGTRAGGVYNGLYSIIDWYKDSVQL